MGSNYAVLHDDISTSRVPNGGADHDRMNYGSEPGSNSSIVAEGDKKRSYRRLLTGEPSPTKARWLRLHKYLYLPRLLTPQERRKAFFLALIFVSFGLVFAGRLYIRFTIPVPAVGGTYREGLLKLPRTVNPVYAFTNDTDRDIAKLVFSRLVTYDGGGNPILDLAENYDVSPDGKIYTVALKKNAFWHDGKKVTADDVIFTVKTIQNPTYKSPLIANWQGVQVEKVDEYTIRFTLRAPYSPFLENLTVGILPKHLWEGVQPEQAVLHELNIKPVGSGPYRFDRFVQERDGSITEYRLSRNPDYYRDGPYINKIVFAFYASFETLIADWRKGKIDGFNPLSKNIEEELNTNKFALFTAETPRVFGIFFNPQKSEVLADKSVRTAIARAIPRDSITNYVLGRASPRRSPFPVYYGRTGTTSRDTLTFDIEAAASALSRAGFKDEDGDGILEKKETKREGKKTVEKVTPISLTLTTSDWPDLLRAAEVIQQNLGAVGIDVSIEGKPISDLESSIIRPRNFQILLFGQAYGYEPDPFIFWHSSQTKDPGLNIVGFNDKTADKILEEIRTMPNRDEREKRLTTLEDRLNQELLMLPLFAEHYLYVLPKSVQGASIKFISLPSDRFNDITSWYIDTKRVLK